MSSRTIVPELKIFAGNAFNMPPPVKHSLKLEITPEFTDLLERHGVTDTDAFYEEANKLLTAPATKKIKERDEPETIEVTSTEGLKFKIPNPKKSRKMNAMPDMKIVADPTMMSPDEM